MRARLIVAMVAGLLLSACTADSPDEDSSSASPGTPLADASPAPEAETSQEPEDAPSAEPEPAEPPADPISVPGLDQETHRGDRLRLGAVREGTAAYTSYDVTYRSRSTTRAG